MFLEKTARQLLFLSIAIAKENRSDYISFKSLERSAPDGLDVQSASRYLAHLGYFSLTNIHSTGSPNGGAFSLTFNRSEPVGVYLTHKALHYRGQRRADLLNLLVGSVLVPVAVSFLTALLVELLR